MSAYVLEFGEIDKSEIAIVGGKGANLGELLKVKGLKVPDGFCVTTEAFREVIAKSTDLSPLLDHLSRLKPDDRNAIRDITSRVRSSIEQVTIPENIAAEITGRIGEGAYAVRSSATAEDLPTASFAGQQDTYLNVIGKDSILKHVSKCWASLFTDRAVTYRLQNNFDHHKVQLSVVIQDMVFPQVAGIMFTADPVTSNRKVLSIDASFGLGEALVSGLVNADVYKVKDESIVEKKISRKKLAIRALESGGTEEQEIQPGQQDRQALTDEQILQLGQIGRNIEQHFGRPQDIEWCLANDTFYIVQSRPITTLFPIPDADDKENHVYVSVGHQQMMTDAIKPLGLSFFLVAGHMRTAGGRLFVDITPQLISPATRNTVVNTLGNSDPLIKDALVTVMGREGFLKLLPDTQQPANVVTPKIDNDPAIVPELIKESKQAIEALKKNIGSKSGTELIDFIQDDIQQRRKRTFESQNMSAIMTAINSAAWINEKMKEWLGEKNIADNLAQSAPNNVTSEMGLALLDVADAIRPCPEVIEYLQQTKDDRFLDELSSLNGGRQVQEAINSFLNKYGMRCVGEIDITRSRWAEKPLTLVPMILGNIKNFSAGESKRKYEQGLKEAISKEKDLINRLRLLPDGDHKADETKRVIDLLRGFAGYREYPKYALINHYFIYKKAILKEAERLVRANVLRDTEDIFYLSLDELRATAQTNKIDHAIIDRRKEDFKQFEKLSPPRVITSDGEIITGRYKREDLPANAIVGLAVSSGIVEGRARVILKIEDAELEDGDILVTPFTDPSWTPLFVSIKALITEVGGLTTHGAVIAREYGLPAIVGVENATKLIKDGQRIRVNGTDGFVEVLT